MEKLEIVRRRMEELAEKQNWIRKGVAEAMKAFEETVLAKRPERFKFWYRLGRVEVGPELWDSYYFFIDEDGVYIQIDHSDWSYDDPDFINSLDSEALREVPVWILRNLGREFDIILDQLAEALKEANESYGEAVEKLKRLAEALKED